MPPHSGQELTIAEEAGGAGALEVVVLAELTLVAAFAVTHTVATLALAAPGARLVLTLPPAGLQVALGASGAVTGLATPAGGTSHFPTAQQDGWAFTIPFTVEETEALSGSKLSRQQCLN